MRKYCQPFALHTTQFADEFLLSIYCVFVLLAQLLDAFCYPVVLPVAYAFLKTDGSTVTFNPEAMRIGYNIKVVGKYIGNTKYAHTESHLSLLLAPFFGATSLGSSMTILMY